MKNRLYLAEFKVDNYGHNTEFTGFENLKTAGYFEAGWSMDVLFHDIFEHFFEDSKYFRTEQLSQAGECVAMGIRTFFYENSGLVQSYVFYNKYNGVEWNSWNTIIGQVGENLNEDNFNQYPNDFNFEHLPQWQYEEEEDNFFEGMVEAYDNYYNIVDNHPQLAKDIERAVNYGYWLGEHLFKDMLYMIDNFCANLEKLIKLLDMEGKDIYESCELPIHDRTLIVDVRTDNIVAKFCGCIISANQGEADLRRNLKHFENQFIEEYYY